jgi:hypothetical protein
VKSAADEMKQNELAISQNLNLIEKLKNVTKQQELTL